MPMECHGVLDLENERSRRVGFCYCISGLLIRYDPISVCGNGNTVCMGHV